MRVLELRHITTSTTPLRVARNRITSSKFLVSWSLGQGGPSAEQEGQHGLAGHHHGHGQLLAPAEVPDVVEVRHPGP